MWPRPQPLVLSSLPRGSPETALGPLLPPASWVSKSLGTLKFIRGCHCGSGGIQYYSSLKLLMARPSLAPEYELLDHQKTVNFWNNICEALSLVLGRNFFHWLNAMSTLAPISASTPIPSCNVISLECHVSFGFQSSQFGNYFYMHNKLLLIIFIDLMLLILLFLGFWHSV